MSQSLKQQAYRRVFSTYGKNKGIIFSAIAELIAGLAMRGVSVILFSLMAGSLVAGDIDQTKNYLLAYFVNSIVAELLRMASDLVGLKSENLVYEEECIVFYERLVSKDMSFYRNNHTGSLIAAFRQYSNAGLLISRWLRKDAILISIFIITPPFILMYYSKTLGILMLIIVVIQVIYIRWSSSQADKYREESHEIYRRIDGIVADNMTNITSYKAAGAEEADLRKMDKLRKEETAAYWNRRKVTTLLNAPRSILTSVFVTALFWVILNMDTGMSQQVTVFVLTMNYVFNMLRSVGQLPDLLGRIDDEITRMTSNIEIMSSDYYEKVVDKPTAKKITIKKGEIDLKNVSFRYKDHSGSSVVLKDFNLKIQGGQSLGVVGLSGAGKSTLLSLLMRFDDIDKGQILIDGQDVTEIKQSSLRRNIAYVSQEPMLFHQTVEDNIRYGNPKSMTQQQVIKAAKAAHAHNFIEDLPDKYKTVVGERGVKLSGGQKQRIVIARAVLGDAPIILFDEATSALDSHSEQIIQRALPEIVGDHTAVIVAHRLSTVAGLDRIIVIDDGLIIEDGTHQQLLDKKGHYYSLWQKQTNQ